MRIRRPIVFLVSALVLTTVTGGLAGQVTKLSDPDVFPASAVTVGLGNTVSGTPAADLYRRLGIRFMSDGEGVPEIRAILTIPTIPPFSEDVLRNAAPEGASGNGALLIRFDSRLRRVGMNLSNGNAESTATLEAFSPDCRLLGSVRQEGLADLPGVFVGLETTDPQGISTLRLSYEGDDPEEQIQFLRFEPLEPRPFVVYLAQTASGASGDLRVETVLQVQNLLGGSQATRVDFLGDEGEPMQVEVEGQTVSSLEFSLATRGARVFHVGGGGPPRSGYARVESDRPVVAQAIYRVFRGGSLVGEAGIDSTPARYSQVASFELDANAGVGLGLAVANPTTASAFVVLSVTDQEVTDVLQAAFNLEPGQHRAFFLTEMLELLDPRNFRGTVQITSIPPVAVTGLRTTAGLPSASLSTASTER